ncbi:MAG: glucose-1-phosphate cytidylyltransferase [Pseudomonadota bacterium]|nr:glucose-1-phosphate cytidylyltransferase [Gammaproteobacteria bacterium]MBU1558940.1 glucose-1-phosphate cytidylyltransferase [Gammaproteobacteria bacterium]MBU1628958.1 glucose-1-phosphate cytidylyltransferase [Gammaproteobacteria bacterium]MBU1927305.1 glucose-1-phosphate cytidylyltransferase [Gammaproteobacteria bacterium]MBU2546206.1 glucose-1-phosphate cytidylyltransferase [Gammaproteobacteria bacterium]
MKVVILAGGLGSRLSEETVIRPKPLTEIGGKPILWHIMKIYSAYGINDFIICLGYKGYMIKEYFSNYFLHMSDVTFDMKENKMQVHQNYAEPWSVTLVDTGNGTMTGGRIKRVRDYLGNEDFCMTYGDGVGNIDIPAVIELHKKEKRFATVTAVQPLGRFGALQMQGNRVMEFEEKPRGDGTWINGGFFVLSPKVMDYIDDDMAIWEQESMRRLVLDHQMAAYFHRGFWQPMDTMREKKILEDLWNTGEAPWAIWN